MKNIAFKVVVFSILFNFSLFACDANSGVSSSCKENGNQFAPFHIIGELLTDESTKSSENHFVAKATENVKKAVESAQESSGTESKGRYAPHLAAEE